MPNKTILIFPFNLMSHYLRCIKLAERYKGHRILFAASEKYDKYVKAAGYSTFNVEGFDPDEVMACAKNFNFSWLNKKNIERIYLSQVEIIDQLKPDLVIGDTSPTLKMAAETMRVKYIALMNGYMTKYYAETRTLLRTHFGYKYLKKMPPKVADKIIFFGERVSFVMIHKPFRQLRRQYHLKYTADYLSEMEGDENLICDDDKLFPQHHLPDNYNIIGPLLYDTHESEEALLSQLDTNKPTLCVCMGSSGDWEHLKFLSDAKYSNLNIITAGDNKGIIHGQHVIKKQFVNLDAILPICSFFICHGGNGTIYKGLQHKIFLLCLTSHFEQEWNVQMLEKFGFGKSINDQPELEIIKHLKNLS